VVDDPAQIAFAYFTEDAEEKRNEACKSDQVVEPMMQGMMFDHADTDFRMR
jgi:hypothetical protein